MKRTANATPPVQETVTASYKNPIIDKIFGRTTLEWGCADGHKEKLTAS